MRRIPGGRDGARPGAVRRPAGSNGSLRGARVVGWRSSVHVPGPAAEGPGGEGCRRLPGRRVPGRDRKPGASSRRDARPRHRPGAVLSKAATAHRGRRMVSVGRGRAGSEGGRGLGMTRSRVGGQGCPDDAAQRVERPAAATALDDPKARNERVSARRRRAESPVRDQDGFPVIEGREERRVTAGRREPLPHAGRRASAVLRPATTAANGRGRPTSRDQRRSQALWPHAHLLTTRLESWPYQRRRGIAWVGMRARRPVDALDASPRPSSSIKGVRPSRLRSSTASRRPRRHRRSASGWMPVGMREARHVPVRGALAARQLLSIQLVAGPGTDQVEPQRLDEALRESHGDRRGTGSQASKPIGYLTLSWIGR